MKIWFTSDLHFNHRNLLKLGKGRPFSSIEEHDETIINNWNKVVAKGDLVYILGDIALACPDEKLIEYFQRLNGAKHLILGNHDRKKELTRLLNNNLLQSIRDYYELKYKAIDGRDYKFVLSHYPILEFNNAHRINWCIHLYGHIHNAVSYDKIYKKLGFIAFHIGLDTNKYTPVCIDEIIKKAQKQELLFNKRKQNDRKIENCSESK